MYYANEMQLLKEDLAISQKKVNGYTHLSRSRIELILSFTVATLSDDFDHIRNNICHSCKNKLVSTNGLVSTPGPSYSHGSTST